jgi:hypothetical protein
VLPIHFVSASPPNMNANPNAQKSTPHMAVSAMHSS